MKKIAYSLILLCLAVTISSCSIKEDITFKKDKSIDYNLSLDATQLYSMIAGMSGKESSNLMNKDSVITFEDVYKKGQYGKLSAEKIELLKHLTMHIYTKNNQFKFEMLGKFTNANQLNETLNLWNTLEAKSTNKGVDFTPYLMIGNYSFEWDGKTMQKIQNKNFKGKSINNTDDQLKNIFSQSHISYIYHFDQPIKKISNQDATMTMDKRTVTSNYEFNEISNHPENGAISITVK